MRTAQVYRFKRSRVHGKDIFTEFVILSPDSFRMIPGKEYRGSTQLDFYRYVSHHFPEWGFFPPVD
jgi:hypothetical protein